MADDRYNRWQGFAISQLTVAVALISGLSVAGLGLSVSLLKEPTFRLTDPYRCLFALSVFLLLATAVLSCGAVVTRLLDFRLTARKLRKEKHSNYTKSLTLFGIDAETYGRLTWKLFWSSCVSFFFGIALLVATVTSGYSDRWDQPAAPASKARN